MEAITQLLKELRPLVLVEAVKARQMLEHHQVTVMLLAVAVVELKMILTTQVVQVPMV